MRNNYLIGFYIFSLLIIVFWTDSFAQKTIIKQNYKITQKQFGLEVRTPADFPTVGLALSGGGARVMAQIGVLKALYEKNIPYNLIVGTSMGSIVGGLIALGYTPAELDSIAKATKWDDLLYSNGRVNRRDLFYERKLTEDKAVFSIRLKGLNPILPTSINDGQKLTNYLNILSFQSPFMQELNFDSLNIRFRAVCTDLAKGNPVVIKSGSVTEALRASASVSFLLSPIMIDSVLLVDGGLTANIPVEICKAEGADFTIAVNTTSDLHSADEMHLPWIVADQILSIPMQLMNNQQLKKADFVFAPKLPGLLSTDFTNIDSVINQGYKSSIKLCDSLSLILKNKYIAALEKNDKFYRNILFGKVPAEILSIHKDFFSNTSIKKSQLILFLDKLNAEDEYADVHYEVSTASDTTLIDLIAIPNPVIQSVNVISLDEKVRKYFKELLSPILSKKYSPKQVVEQLRYALSTFHNSGYSLAGIDSVQFIFDKHEFRVYLNTGVINKIDVTGNTSTSLHVIRREIPINEGEVFSSSKLEEGFSNLRALNIFDNILVSLERKDKNNILVFRLTEKNTGIARFGFKLNNENFPQASIDVRDENLFGLGLELGLQVYLSPKSTSYIIEQKANRIYNTYFTYDIKLHAQTNDINVWDESISATDPSKYEKKIKGEYRNYIHGASFSVGGQMERFGDVVVRGNYEIDETKSITSASDKEFRNRLVTLRVSSNIDTQDKYPYPNKGLKFYGFYELASKAFGSEIGYTKFGGEYLVNVPLFLKHTLSSAAKVGYADNTLPLTQQYTLGGQYSFWGMRENESIGRQVFLGSLEYRYMLPFKLYFDTYFRLRYDLGSTWAKEDAIRFKDLKHGIGTTISINSPIGPADFSVGRSFTINRGSTKNPIIYGPIYFYFSIGFYY